jgi:hypothetical protein
MLYKDNKNLFNKMSLEAYSSGTNFATIDNGGGARQDENGRWVSFRTYREELKAKYEREWAAMSRGERLVWWMKRPFAYVYDTNSAARNMGYAGTIPGTRVWIDGTYYGFDGKKRE